MIKRFYLLFSITLLFSQLSATNDKFLQITFDQGNDLITPRPEFKFPGLKDGDSWCDCALRW